MATITKHVKAVIQLRRAKEQEWIDLNPILRVGEPALSTDVYKLKIGDGNRSWAEIPYLNETEIQAFKELLESDYATKEYVNENGGKINSITINGIEQPIDENKNINLDVAASYTASGGIKIEDNEFSLDDLILDCGTSTTNI